MTKEIELILSRDYTKFIDPIEKRPFFQKKVTDDTGILYFLNVYLDRYMTTGDSSSPDFPNRAWEMRISFDVDGGYSWVSLTSSSVEEAELIAHKLWTACGSKYYSLKDE